MLRGFFVLRCEQLHPQFCNMSQKPTDYQILNEYFLGNIEEDELTPHQQEKLRRVNHCYRMLNDMRPSIEIVKKLMKKYSVSRSSAFRDLGLCQQIFGDLRKPNKAFKRSIAEKMALDTYRMAKKAGDTSGMARANKNYIEATGANIEDPEMPDFDKLQPSVYAIVVAPEVEGMINAMLGQAGPVNLSKLYDKHAEDIEAVPVRDDQGEDTEATQQRREELGESE